METITAKRRDALVRAVNVPIILSAHGEMQQRADSAYPFTQEASFLYFTGIDAPEWKVLYDGNSWVAVRPGTSETKQVFDGTLSDADIRSVSGIDVIIDEKEYDARLVTLAAQFEVVATIGPDPMQKYYDFTPNPAPIRLHSALKRSFKEVRDCRDAVRKLRALKSEEEVEYLQQAVDLTTAAFSQVKQGIGDYSHEYQIEAAFHKAFRETGADGHAYGPIVAAGGNACTLHYVKNNAELPKNGLVLLDIGARIGGYAADITRTFAIGTPTDRQIEVHAAVESAHLAIIELIRPGMPFEEYQHEVDAIMQRALSGLGLLGGEDEGAYRRYFPHAIGHGLGIDVHESLGGYKEMRPGMVMTVEPGIYIPEEGIGVRIEDDILVTENGYKNLSAGLPTSL